VTARLEISDAAFRMLDHVLLGAEDDRFGRAGLRAGRSLADSNPVGAESTLVGTMVGLRDARDVEGAAFHAVAAADTVLVDEVHDTVGVLHDCTGRGT